MHQPTIKNILLITTHFTILALILGVSFLGAELNIILLLFLASIESALLGKNVVNDLLGRTINISFEDEHGPENNIKD